MTLSDDASSMLNVNPQDPCPQCGMPLGAEGTQPTTRDGTTYCCEGCANRGECTCDSHGHR